MIQKTQRKSLVFINRTQVIRTDNNTKNIELVFQYLDELLENKNDKTPRKQIGFKIKKG